MECVYERERERERESRGGDVRVWDMYSSDYFFPLISLQLGGTIGDIEGMPFVEAFRQFQFRCGSSNFANVHVSLVPQVHLHTSLYVTHASLCLKPAYVT